MKQILNDYEAIKKAEELRKKGKKIVLAGGCFDILHIGHIDFLQAAKARGDVLFIILESDDAIKKSKGNNRPINPQKIRAQILTELKSIDYIILLPKAMDNKKYDDLVIGIKPTIIATTKGDSNRLHKERQASIIGARVVDVVGMEHNTSTTNIAKLLENEL